MNSDMLTHALEYVTKYNWSIFPLHYPVDGKCSCGNPDCKDIGKHPLTPHGFKDATTDPEIIKQWWATWPNANIGLATGKISGVVVLDVDGEEGIHSIEEIKAQGLFLPETLVVKTGKGYHYYFQSPESDFPTSTRFLPGFDTRGDGGYVILPPSLHFSGKQYEWDDESASIAPCPSWLVSMVNGHKMKGEASSNSPIYEGSRNDFLTKVAGSLRRHGCDEETIFTILTDVNRVKCSPPLDEKEIKKIAHSISQYPPEESNNSIDFDPNDFLRRPDPNETDKITWTIPGLIPQGYLTWLVGYPKTGKSWLALKLACDASLGGPILDGVSETGEPIRVLYVLSDTTRVQPMSRLRQTRWNYNRENIHFVYQNELAEAHKEIDLKTENGRRILETLIECSKAQLIILDSMSSLISNDLMTEENAKPIALNLNHLAGRFNIGLVVLYHTRKPTKEQERMSISQHDISGSGVLMRFAGSSIGVELKVKKTGEKKHLVRYLAGWVEEFPSFSFTLEDELDEQDQERTVMTINKNPDGKSFKEIIWDQIQVSFSDVEFTRTELMEQLPVEVSEVHVRKIIHKLVEQEKLRMVGRTKNARYSICKQEPRVGSEEYTNQDKVPSYSQKDLYTQSDTLPQKVSDYYPEYQIPEDG